ncbi:MAG: DltE [Deinococcus sp.]|nr:DltE [Deinococcus sp.]
MNQTGNTILITGGGSGIGRALAESFQRAGNQVIIAGRRQDVLDETVAANPGMNSALLDIARAEDIQRFATRLTADFPGLNVVIHNAGIMRPEQLKDAALDDAEATIATNLLGPIRLTAALLPHLLAQPSAALLTVSSGLAFVPMALTPTYSATKAAIHSYTQSLRHQLRGTSVEVFELVPPYVQTELMGAAQASDPHAMPLQEFIDETVSLLEQLPHGGEVLVERVKALRLAEATGNYEFMYSQINPA